MALSKHLTCPNPRRSLILVVLIVFGCIIVSFVLSSLKQRHDIESWGLFAGTAFNNLATTVTGRHGIIAPQLHYYPKNKKKKREREDVEEEEEEEEREREERETAADMASVVVTDLGGAEEQEERAGHLPTIAEGVVVGVVRDGTTKTRQTRFVACVI